MGSVNGRLKKIKSKSKIFLILGMYKPYNIIIGRFKPTSFIMLNKIIVKPGVPFITIL